MTCGILLNMYFLSQGYSLFDLNDWTIFCMINFPMHLATDYFTSRLNAVLWADGKVHDFFVSVGFDQWLHFVALALTYSWFIL